MAETNIAFSKIVSTPTPTAWSQAYSAGRVFASISIESEQASAEEEHLSLIGKDLISTFESEFFTLETKNLETIKQALSTTISKVGDDVKISMVLCFLEENVLYLFAVGGGKAVLKRGDKVGTVLEGEDGQSVVKPASGYVQEGDLIILETKQFLKIIPPSTLASALEAGIPEEIAENLAPHVHERAEGGASSVVLMYKKNGVQPVVLPDEETINSNSTEEGISETDDEDEVIPIEDLDEEQSLEKNQKEQAAGEPDLEDTEKFTEETPTTEALTQSEEDIEEEIASPFVTEDKFASQKRSRFNFVKFNFLPALWAKIPRGRRRLAAIAIGLVILIIVVSIFAISKNNFGQNDQLFTKILADAKTKYDEGENLKDLNASLSQDSFKQAKDILVKNEEKFKNNSTQNKQLQELLGKINSEIKKEGGELVSPKEVGKEASQILSSEIGNASGLFFSENKNNVVSIDKSGVTQIDKGNGKKSQIIKKDWQTAGGIGAFGSNIYVLDKSSGILKYVPSADTYSKTDYFASDAPDLKDSISMAIDGSVYILFKDGSIKKYTRGKADKFEISGLSKPLSSSAKLFTNEDLNNLYVLDIPNSRIVVFGKEGEFKTSYSADIIKSARDFDVKEADKKAYILSGDKIYQIDLK